MTVLAGRFPRLLLAVTLAVPGAAAPALAAGAVKAQARKPAATAAVKKVPARKPAATAAVKKVPARKPAATVSPKAARDQTIPRFKVDAAGEVVPDLRAAAAIIYNTGTDEVIWEEHAQDQRSIASITKVMTAAVFVESAPDMSREVVVTRADVLKASWTYLAANERIKVGDLFHLLLVASDNAAARVLARLSPWGAAGFVQRMNDKAAELGLTNTVYADPSGLDAANVSSAYDMARLMAHVAADQRIASVMQLPQYTYRSSRRRLTINSTNQFVRTGEVDVLTGKTGFIRQAGYCLATVLRLHETGPELAVVVLGARSNAGRFTEARNLVKWLSARPGDLFSK